jgi:hypothetical protein
LLEERLLPVPIERFWVIANAPVRRGDGVCGYLYLRRLAELKTELSGDGSHGLRRRHGAEAGLG